MSDLDDVQNLVAEYMNEIAICFKPGVKITVLVRTPDFPLRDFVMTSDTEGEIIEMVKRRFAAGPGKAGPHVMTESKLHRPGGFETEHGSFRSGERARIVARGGGWSGVIGEVLPDGEADIVFDDGSGGTFKWSAFRKVPINEH